MALCDSNAPPSASTSSLFGQATVASSVAPPVPSSFAPWGAYGFTRDALRSRDRRRRWHRRGDELASGGLTGLRDRVEALGGAFDLDSPIGHGTRVDAVLPQRPAEQAGVEPDLPL